MWKIQLSQTINETMLPNTCPSKTEVHLMLNFKACFG